MDLYQIRYFLAIAETGGFTRASERLYVSQPSLSVGIKKLEQEMGVVLFERGGRRAILTPAGKVFEEKAKTILNEYHSALHELKGFQNQPILRLGALRSIRIAALSRLLGTFREKYPQVIIEFLDGNLAELRDWLERGNIDLAMTVLGNHESPKTSLALFSQRRLLAVSKTHPFAQRGTVRVTELDKQPYIERMNCELWGEICQLFESQGVQPQVVYRAAHEEWVFSLVAAGLGVTIMPEWQDVSDVAYIPLADLNLHRTVGLSWRVQQDSPVIELFRTFAASHDWR